GQRHRGVRRRASLVRLCRRPGDRSGRLRHHAVRRAGAQRLRHRGALGRQRIPRHERRRGLRHGPGDRRDRRGRPGRPVERRRRDQRDDRQRRHDRGDGRPDARPTATRDQGRRRGQRHPEEVDAGAILLLDGAVASSQVIDFAPNTSDQLGQDPYTPSTLVLAAPPTTATITGFTYADRIVLSGVTVSSASYAGSTLSVLTSSGTTLTYALTGDLAGLTLDTDAASQGIIQFDASSSPALPGDTVVDQIIVSGGTVIEPPGHVTANGIGGVAVSVDGGGVLALAGGSVVTAEQSAVVGDAG